MPAALPFIFNALKINSTPILIRATVAEFFGTSIVGMGFRINIADGRLEVDLVWAAIAVAAFAGSAFYGIVALSERAATFWHPSIHGGETTFQEEYSMRAVKFVAAILVLVLATSAPAFATTAQPGDVMCVWHAGSWTCWVVKR